MGKLETLKALSLLQLAYPKSFEEKQLELYVNMLEDIPPETLFLAVKKLINTSVFLPTIADLRRESNTFTEITNGSQSMDADEAWGKVQKAIASVGMYSMPEFDDDVLTETVNNLGWKEICMTPIDDTVILRAQFRKAFEQAKNRKQTQKDIKEAMKSISSGTKHRGLLPNLNDMYRR